MVESDRPSADRADTLRSAADAEPASTREPPPPAFRNGMPKSLIAMLVVYGLSLVTLVVAIALFKPPGG